MLAGAMYGLAQAVTLPAIFGFAAAAGFTVVGGLYVLYALAPIYYPVHVRAAGAGRPSRWDASAPSPVP
uniref:Uncharacterized protein n=1 Tax=Phenylobacterium glaciei TaxID=2803784 RepID=A0A974P3Y8_9CAUL|nr:hypothetical protein JKL49_25040 [Phenylobacterium glaciei]